MLFRPFMALLALTGSSLIAQTSAASASRGAAELVAAGYEIVDVQWNVTPIPGGQPVHLNGTVQDIMAELTKLNPNWEADHKNHLASVTAADVKKRESTNTNVKKIEELGHWINKKPCVPGEPGEGPGPKQCGRVSCSWSAAIYWCNDNQEAVTLGSYRWIASGASYVYLSCRTWNGDEYTVSGQAFNTYDWNVYVTNDWC